MAVGIKAIYNDQAVFLEVLGNKLLIKTEKAGKQDSIVKIILLKEIKSLHVNNEDRFLLKIKLSNESVIFQFQNKDLRDVAKAIFLSHIKTEQEIIKRIIETDANMKSMFSILKSHISTLKFWNINREKIKEMSILAKQISSKDIDMDIGTFVTMLPTPLLKVFSETNYSLNQFYNLLNQSYFFNILNKKNDLDRLIFDSLRDYSTEQNYATRLNTASILHLKPMDETVITPVFKPKKEVLFDPIYPYEKNIPDRPKREFKFEEAPLVCDIKTENVDVPEKIHFEKADLLLGRDLSKLVYKAKQVNDTEFLSDAARINENYIRDIQGKYGKKAFMFIEKILPSHFMNNKS